MNRRELIKLASAAALAQSLPRCLLAMTTPGMNATNPFALGVASGSPRHDGVVLWTRLLPPPGGFGDKPVPVHWEIADDEQFRHIVQRGSAAALSDLGHSVHVEATGLRPDRWYFYRFHSGQNTSMVGRTRTFPAPGSPAAKMRLSYASCQRWEHGYFSAWRHMQDEQLDAVFFVGDYIYEYTRGKKDVRSHDLSRPVDLAGYRDRYALYKSDVDLQGMHAQCPWLLTWDDHEVSNDYAGANAPGLPASFLAQRAAAYQAYYENMPLRASVLTRALQGLRDGAEMRIYDRCAFGGLAEFHILDTRQYRMLQACSDGGKGGGASVDLKTCEALHDPARSMLGTEQEKWLFDGLRNSHKPASKWTFIVQETRFGALPNYGRKTTASNDTWDGYPDTRRRVVDALLQSKAPNPVVLGGDVHSSWVGHVKADYDKPESANVGVEFTGTSISSNHNSPENISRHVEQNPHFVFGDGYKRGYGVVEITPKQLTTTLRVVSDVSRADSSVETQARFSVEAGHPLLQKA